MQAHGGTIDLLDDENRTPLEYRAPLHSAGQRGFENAQDWDLPYTAAPISGSMLL